MRQTFKIPSRKYIHTIWNKVRTLEPLDEDENILAVALCSHPEYAELWAHVDKLSRKQIERKYGVDPVLHVTLHQAIEKQIRDRNPPETGEVVLALTQQGVPRHEAVHRVMLVLADEVWDVLYKKQPLNYARYARKLQKLLEA